MTRPGRQDHIIPVLLDDIGAQGVVGMPATLGRIDLREIWADMKKTQTLTQDMTNALRNRCILPILEKLDAADATI